MKFQVLLTEQISPVGIEMLEKAAKVVIAPSPSDADLLPLIGDADALLIRSTNLTIPVMEAGEELKVIGRHGIGLDNIEIPAATSLGIQVVNTPGANTNAVAEHALWAMMHCAKNFNRAEQALREGKFSVAGSLPGLVQKFGYSTLELKAKTLGLVGFGRIARRLSELARCLQMDIKAYDPLVPDEAFKALCRPSGPHRRRGNPGLRLRLPPRSLYEGYPSPHRSEGTCPHEAGGLPHQHIPGWDRR